MSTPRPLFLLLTLLASPALADPSVTVAFSPGNAAETVVGVIDSAKSTIHLAGYGFTSRPIADALISARRRGVDVEAVLDRSNETARHSEAGELVRAGIPVRIDSRYPIMHSKYMAIDGKTVETGSFNFTRQAERNGENVLILRDVPGVASQYEKNWQGLWAESRDYGASEAP